MKLLILLLQILLELAHGIGGVGNNIPSDFSPLRKCEPIRFEMCRGIGYNDTSMPNLVGHELQFEVELTLQTYAPLIEYVCSTQLKLFLCAAFVPMCTPKVPVPIGPCRSLCESVRSRCSPVLQGFGYPWPPALNCSRFPKENNHETMCMEGPGEAHLTLQDPSNPDVVYDTGRPSLPVLECPDQYVKLYRSGRCAPLCEATILFGDHEKHLSEVWVATWTYAALGLALVATLCLIVSDDTKTSSKWLRMLTPLVWCHDMVAIGWTVRFVSGRLSTACGSDPQLPNVSLLLIDGLSNASCAANFLLRYYFGMAACVWWAILCLSWHRNVRRNSPDVQLQIVLGGSSTYVETPKGNNTHNRTGGNGYKRHQEVTHNNLERFAAWGLPAFQTAVIIVARLVDADELLGACFVGNQSDKGLQIWVATPLFCYWIFGSMNLISGYLVHRRNKEIAQNTNSSGLQHHPKSKSANSGIGTFLFIYCVPYALLLIAVIYEFVNIDIWLNVSDYQITDDSISTPLWPFLTRAFMELMLGIICFAWVLGPKISTMYKLQLIPRPLKQAQTRTTPHQGSRSSTTAFSTVSYQTVRHPPAPSQLSSGLISMNLVSNYSVGRIKCPPHMYVNRSSYKQGKQFNRYDNETVL